MYTVTITDRVVVMIVLGCAWTMDDNEIGSPTPPNIAVKIPSTTTQHMNDSEQSLFTAPVTLLIS